ncbi:MAG: sigma-70 family RNA polymerase sigma factor [Acidobacteriota bacterium]
MSEPAVAQAEVDRGGFADLVREHQAMVFSIAYHFLHDRTLAEEVAQDVFLQLHRALPALKSAEHVTFWLRRTTSHRSIDYARRRRVRQVSLEEAPELSTAPDPGDPMLARRLRRLVASLPEKPRLVVTLRYQEGLEPDEIARVLAMPVRTVKSHLQRSLAILRDKASRYLRMESYEPL